MVWFVGAVALVVGLLSALVARAMRSVRLCEPRLEPIALDAVPPEVRAQLARSTAQLQALGYECAAAARSWSQVVAGQAQLAHVLLFLHPALPVCAVLAQAVATHRERDDALSFGSQRGDGRILLTRNRQAIGGPYLAPHVETHDCWLPTWAALHDAHLARMNAMQDPAQPWVRSSVDDVFASSARNDALAFAQMVERGLLVAAGPGVWRASWRYTLACVGRAWRYLLPSLRRMQPDEGAPSELSQVEAFERDARAADAAPSSAQSKWTVFFVTAALAALSFGFDARSLGWLAALMLVLSIHEGGHFLAMRWAGYRDLKVFFLPFIGAAASGRHDRPTLRQELIVLYAGPLPGIVLGVALHLLLPPQEAASWWHDFASMAVVVNVLNLLPIHPLDGGKIVELLLLSRWPWLAFTARLAGIAALAALAWSIDDGLWRSVMLALALLLALGIGQMRREARVARALQRDGVRGGLDRTGALRVVFDAIDRLGLGALAWQTRRAIAAALLPGLLRAWPSAATRVGGTLLYLVLLLAGIAAVFVQPLMAGVQAVASDAPSEQQMVERMADERKRQLADTMGRAIHEPDAQKRWDLLAPMFMVAAEAAAENPAAPPPAAQALLAEARSLAPRLPDAAAKTARLELALLGTARTEGERLQHADAALAVLDAAGTAPDDVSPLLEATAAWLRHAPAAAVQAAGRERIERSLRLARDRGEGWAWQEVQGRYVDLLLAAGEREQALARARAHLPPLGLADVLWMVEGAGPALAAIEAALAAPPQRAGDAALRRLALEAPLLRRGMQIAESAGRSDWQRAHVARLASAQEEIGLPWWLRAYMWIAGAPNAGAGPTLRDVELAHWRGDAQRAQRVADELRRTQPKFAVRVFEGAANLQPTVAQQVQRRLDAQSRAFAQRYGLPVQDLSAAAPR